MDAEREMRKFSVASSKQAQVQDSSKRISMDVDLSPALQADYEQIIQAIAVYISIQRDLNILLDVQADRNAKKKALEKIARDSVSRSQGLDPLLARKLLMDVSSALIRSLYDSIEKVRELAVDTLKRFVEACGTLTSNHIETLLPPVLHRLSPQQSTIPTPTEPSEETRLSLIRLAISIVQSSPVLMAPFLPALSVAAVAALHDSYAEVKKEGCRLVQVMWTEAARFVRGNSSAAVAKAIVVGVLSHRHSGVRIAGIRALKCVIIADATVLDESLDALMTLTLDKASSVREALYEAAIEWALHLDDRYSFGYKFYPIILAGCSDEVPKLAELCWTGVDDIGIQYEHDWEDRVKDEMEYDLSTTSNTTSVTPQRRIRVGSRHAFKDHSMKMVDKFAQGLIHWTPDTRAKTAQILAVYLRIVQQHATGYVNILLPPLCRICSSDESWVIQHAVSCAELIGCFITSDVYLPHIVGPIKVAPTSSARLGNLRVLSGLIRGASVPKNIERKELKKLVEAVTDVEFSLTESVPVVSAIGDCLVEISGQVTLSNSNSGSNSGVGEFETLLGCVIVSTTPGDERLLGWSDLPKKANVAMSKLVELHHFSRTTELFALHLPTSLSWLINASRVWTRHTPERRLLSPLISESGSAIGNHLEQFVVLVCDLCTKERDGDIRVSVFALLHNLITSGYLNSSNTCVQYTPKIITQAILPSVIWRPGRDAAFIRGRGLQVLVAFILSDLVLKSDLDEIFEVALSPAFVGCIDDDDVGSRKGCLQALCRILEGGVVMSDAVYKSLYPELIKRLDDAQDVIRIEACRTLIAFYHHVRANWDANGSKLDGEAWNGMIKSITVHVDDVNPSVQEAALEALKACAVLAPREATIAEIESVRSRHRSPKYLDVVLGILRN
ncbi:hypothetical protein SmJEL517_g00497 [Synchytrium microbalum]|uniref:TOG domain-containing protein n=1 Tax=Synchytrium microbalum TaxID=1806994 RepID=A0A507CHI0_9FUNG|nr:uncharacterized protein SmJEL517_g00497 [Synchytrium microbalum]TPX37536.1 hypothetical protein SmJEL517_g00497 [Synchytrium microbalum]